jgi:type II secretory pathway pseudopilin PulG
MSADSAQPRADGGFTLVETLVSLVMLTLCLAALIEVFGGGFRGIRSSEMDAAALHLARQQLALAGTELPLSPGQMQGTAAGGLQWSLTIEPYEPPRAGLMSAALSGPAPGLEAYWVVSEVRWDASALASPRSVSLTTLRLSSP